MTKFKKKLIDKLENRIPDGLLTLLPSGFQQIGNNAILNLKPELERYKDQIADIILEEVPTIKGIYLKRGGISGMFREPNISFIRGKNDPIIQHKEHGIVFKFDMTKIMFAKGNVSERLRFTKLVKPNEIVFDLFSGIGYFSLMIAKYCSPEKIYAFELNPISYQYLVENIKINKINKEREILKPILGDSNVEMLKIGEKADRVIMGVLPSPRGHLKNVFKIINEKFAIIHYEGLLKSGEPPDILLKDVIEIASRVNRKVNLLKTNIVKSYGPKTNHVTLDIEIV
ncbi:MAG: class I SAM-dependent methyltransferase [Candidatus Helarchaeota archaeon]